MAYVTGQGLFTGLDANSFGPDIIMTRAMFVTVLGRLAAINAELYQDSPFADSAIDTWYGPYVAWAAQNGVVNGVGADIFAPDAPLTREQLTAIIYRYSVLRDDISAVNPAALEDFADASMVSAWAREAMSWAVANGIINGSNGYLLPQDGATRAQVAQMMMNYLQ